MNRPISATVILQRQDGTVLMQLRDDGSGFAIPCPKMWNFPGGAVEPNEQPLEAAIREIAEEFEIDLDPSSCTEIWRYSHEHAAIDHIFLCPTPADTIPILHEGAGWAWMTLTEIAGLELGFEQAKIVEYMLRIQARGNPY